MGIGPTLSAWEAEVLPLNYTRIFKFRLQFYLIPMTFFVELEFL
jgi:hypothetical protein